MGVSDGYGERFGEQLRVAEAPVVTTRALQSTVMAVTEVKCDYALNEMSGLLRREDAFLVGFLLHDFLKCQLWEDGRLLAPTDLRAGEITITDLKSEPGALLDHPFHAMYFYLPRNALNAVADDANAPRVGDLDCRPRGFNDPTIANLARAVLPALTRPQQTSQLFLDHVLFAVGAHVAQAYGGMRPLSQPPRGGLAPWQVRRATEILSAHLDGNLPLPEVAEQCGLSVSHFSRAFHQTTGLPPHRWLMAKRVKVAKEKLRDQRLSLSDVAIACGFSDQSHLTRVFTQMSGTTPGLWRRTLKR